MAKNDRIMSKSTAQTFRVAFGNMVKFDKKTGKYSLR